MASHHAATGEVNLGIAENVSYVRGYHVYKVDWTPFRRDVLQLKRDSDKFVDQSAIAVMKSDTVVNHVEDFTWQKPFEIVAGNTWNHAIHITIVQCSP